MRHGLRRHRIEAHRLAIRQRPDASVAEDEELEFSARLKLRPTGIDPKALAL
jgi:hypothetical protein